MKIMKEFVWINRNFFLILAFGQVVEKNKDKDLIHIKQRLVWAPMLVDPERLPSMLMR